MLTDIPNAKQYIFMPSNEPSVSLPVGDARICGSDGSTLTFSQLLMDEIAKVMTDDDVAGVTGITGEKCILVIKQDKKFLEDLIVGGHIAVDSIFKEHPHLVPPGGFILRDWEDIPDEEKAGNPKNKS